MQGFTLRQGQRVRIGEHIVVTVQRIRGGSVRLGFLVPAELTVDREEIAEFKHRASVERNLSEASQPAASQSGTSQGQRPSSDHTKGT